jgi:hypothetical protein
VRQSVLHVSHMRGMWGYAGGPQGMSSLQGHLIALCCSSSTSLTVTHAILKQVVFISASVCTCPRFADNMEIKARKLAKQQVLPLQVRDQAAVQTCQWHSFQGCLLSECCCTNAAVVHAGGQCPAPGNRGGREPHGICTGRPVRHPVHNLSASGHRRGWHCCVHDDGDRRPHPCTAAGVRHNNRHDPACSAHQQWRHPLHSPACRWSPPARPHALPGSHAAALRQRAPGYIHADCCACRCVPVHKICTACKICTPPATGVTTGCNCLMTEREFGVLSSPPRVAVQAA